MSAVCAAMADTPIAAYVEPLARLHAVLCPRQILGVRRALLAARVLPAAFPQTSKDVVALVEIDVCGYADRDGAPHLIVWHALLVLSVTRW